VTKENIKMPLFMTVEFLELYGYVKWSIVYTSGVVMYKKYNMHASGSTAHNT
jgi:hypothetical protein